MLARPLVSGVRPNNFQVGAVVWHAHTHTKQIVVESVKESQGEKPHSERHPRLVVETLRDFILFWKQDFRVGEG